MILPCINNNSLDIFYESNTHTLILDNCRVWYPGSVSEYNTVCVTIIGNQNPYWIALMNYIKVLEFIQAWGSNGRTECFYFFSLEDLSINILMLLRNNTSIIASCIFFWHDDMKQCMRESKISDSQNFVAFHQQNNLG